MKTLIAYFSRAGGNYVGGSIVKLPVGNTELAAKTIQRLSGGGLFRIETVKDYPDDYHRATEVAKEEQNSGARPELIGSVANMEDYGLIVLGYPNWWGTMPMPVCTFLEEYDFSGKTIIPFCTNGGSGLGRSEKDIAALCPKARLLGGLAVSASGAEGARAEVMAWLAGLGY
jgi:flavodoxin